MAKRRHGSVNIFYYVHQVAAHIAKLFLVGVFGTPIFGKGRS